MSRFPLFLPLLALLCSRVEAIVVIDDFNASYSLTIPGSNPGVTSLFASNATSEALGGERDIYIERTSGNSGAVSMDVSQSLASQLSYASAPFTTGNLLLVYDGADNSSILNPTGLGGIDITQSGINTGIFLRSASDLGSSITFSIYTDADRWSMLTLPIAANPSFAFTDYFGTFTSFTSMGAMGGADFMNVGAISLLLDGSTAGTDVSIETVVATVPEPGGCLLIFSAGLMLLFRRKSARR
jgi:large repetitive protein